MDMIRVNSAAINRIGYDSQTGRMKIEFAQGEIYNFCRVPESIFKGLLNAPSKGTYYNTYIRGKYQC